MAGKTLSYAKEYVESNKIKNKKTTKVKLTVYINRKKHYKKCNRNLKSCEYYQTKYDTLKQKQCQLKLYQTKLSTEMPSQVSITWCLSQSINDKTPELLLCTSLKVAIITNMRKRRAP